MGFFNSIFGNNNKEQEWVSRFLQWADEGGRMRREYPALLSDLVYEFNELEWLTRNFVRGYANQYAIYRDMSDSYISICWQACHFGDFSVAKSALGRAKQWAESRIWPSDVPVKIGGQPKEREYSQEELPYIECSTCNRASFCKDLPK